MKQQTKQKLFSLLYIIMIVVVIGTCIFLIHYITTQNVSCLIDPISYYENASGKMCYCNDGLGWMRG